MQLEFFDHVSIGAAVGTVIGFFRLVEKFGPRLFGKDRKNGAEKVYVVELSPETHLLIQQTRETTGRIELKTERIDTRLSDLQRMAGT